MKKNILFCEDDPDLQDQTAELLEEAFPESLVILCENGLDAIDQLRCMDFDIILSDFDMKTQGGDGLSLFEYTEKQGLSIPFILYSGHSVLEFSHIKNNRFHFVDKLTTDPNQIKNILKDLLQ